MAHLILFLLTTYNVHFNKQQTPVNQQWDLLINVWRVPLSVFANWNSKLKCGLILHVYKVAFQQLSFILRARDVDVLTLFYLSVFTNFVSTSSR